MNAGRSWVLLHLVVCGMSTIAVEVSAFRLLAPSFGSTQFITTNVLGVVLASLAAGYWFGGRIADRHPRAAVLYYISAAAALLLIVLPWVADPILDAARPALHNQDASLFAGTLFAMAALFAIPMFLLGMVSPFTIRLLARGDAAAGSSSGLVFSLSTVGSIAGAYIPTLLTAPWLGTRATIQLFGAIVLCIAAAGLVIERRRLQGAAGLLVTVFPVVMAFAPPLKALPAGVLASAETEYHVVRVVRDETNKRNLLELNEGLSYHSMAYDDRRSSSGVWGYLQLFPRMFPAPTGGPKPQIRICIIGLAAGTIATQIQREWSAEYDLEIDGVEIDPVIVEFGRRFFGLDERCLKIFIEDGRTFLSRTPKKYHIIMGDAYRQPYIPAHLVTREFFAQARARLLPGGVCSINAGAPDTNSPVLRGIQNSMVAAFSNGGAVERFVVRNQDVPFHNFIIMGSDGPLRERWASIGDQRFIPWRDAALRDWSGVNRDPGAPLFTDDCSPVEWYTDWSILQVATQTRK